MQGGKHASSNLTSKCLGYTSRKKRKIGVALESPATTTLAWRTNGSKTQFHATVHNPELGSPPCLRSQSGWLRAGTTSSQSIKEASHLRVSIWCCPETRECTPQTQKSQECCQRNGGLLGIRRIGFSGFDAVQNNFLPFEPSSTKSTSTN